VKVQIYFSRLLNIDEDSHFPWRILEDEDQDRARALAVEQLSTALTENCFILVPPGIVLQPLVEAACVHCLKRLYGEFQIRLHFRRYARLFAAIHLFLFWTQAFMPYQNPNVLKTSICTWMP
jgi:predicted transcriptional regulator